MEGSAQRQLLPWRNSEMGAGQEPAAQQTLRGGHVTEACTPECGGNKDKSCHREKAAEGWSGEQPPSPAGVCCPGGQTAAGRASGQHRAKAV